VIFPCGGCWARRHVLSPLFFPFPGRFAPLESPTYCLPPVFFFSSLGEHPPCNRSWQSPLGLSNMTFLFNPLPPPIVNSPPVPITRPTQDAIDKHPPGSSTYYDAPASFFPDFLPDSYVQYSRFFGFPPRKPSVSLLLLQSCSSLAQSYDVDHLLFTFPLDQLLFFICHKSHKRFQRLPRPPYHYFFPSTLVTLPFTLLSNPFFPPPRGEPK